MKNTTHTGDGKTTVFPIGFIFFDDADVCVSVNGTVIQQQEYSIEKPDNYDAYPPFDNGCIQFITPPLNGCEIKIERKLSFSNAVIKRCMQNKELTRLRGLNRLMNFTIEELRDLSDAVENIKVPQIPEIPEMPDLTDYAKKSEIPDINPIIEDIADIKSDIEPLKRSGVDYVVESAMGLENGGWYRKYKSGWVEQGGKGQTSQQGAATSTYPIPLISAPVARNITIQDSENTNSLSVKLTPSTGSTSMRVVISLPNNIGISMPYFWEVKGMASV